MKDINYQVSEQCKSESINLSKSVKRYLHYVKEISIEKEIQSSFCFPYDVIPTQEYSFEKITIILNNVAICLKSLPDDKNSNFYFIEEGDRDEWVTRTNEYLFEYKDGYNVFLWISSKTSKEESDKIRINKECKELNFGYSRLLRDAIKADKKGFDIDLSIEENLFKNEWQSKIDIFLGDIEKKKYEKIYDRINETMQNYFICPLIKKSDAVLKKYLIDFYSYGLNAGAFGEIKNDSEKEKHFEQIEFSKMEVGHKLAGLGVDLIRKRANEQQSKKGEEKNNEKIPFDKLGHLVNWYFRINILSDLVKLLVYYKEPKKQVDILLIDDNPDGVKIELDQVKYWLDNRVNINEMPLKSNYSVEENFENYIEPIKNGDYDFILVDLDHEGEPKGFDYLRYLRQNKSVYDKPYVIVFSRNENAVDIQKALNMGALFFASKQNFARLILEIFKVLPIMESDQDKKEAKNEKNIDFPLGQNWSLLYQLPLAKILELKNEKRKIKGRSYKPFFINGNNDEDDFGFDDNVKNDEEYNWINKLPKAELHNHIGSVLGADLIPKTALIVLTQLYNKKKEDYPIDEIIKFLLPVASDPFLFEQHDKNAEFIIANPLCKQQEWFIFKEFLILDKNTQFHHQSVFTIISDSLNLKANLNKPEEVLLSPQDETIEKLFHPISKIRNSYYFKSKLKLRELGISYDEVILFFILMVDVRNYLTFSMDSVELPEQLLQDRLNKIAEDIREVHDLYTKNIGNPSLELPQNLIINFINRLTEIFRTGKYRQMLQRIVSDNLDVGQDNILKFLISAHSKQRCLPYDNRGLFNYLRGCEYGGAQHLQSKESIFVAAHHIIFKYAIPNNIRYLDLRCAIDGYTKFNLIATTDEAANILCEAFTFWQGVAANGEDKKKVHVNIIVTAKRHKSLKEFEDNVTLATNLYKNNPTEENKTDEKYTNKNKSIEEKKIDKEDKSFFSGNTEIVSFDIAGIEKNNRVSKFMDQLKPLMLHCVPITIHAGEEDSHEAIWEAVYLAHSQRLGHALSLVQNDRLKDLIRETGVNIELCPISNYLTNNKYNFSSKEGRCEKYPLKKYLEDRISISINTDNPYVSDSDLSKEFLFAAKMSGGLTKWEILKIILYSFKSITIPKKEKTKLLKEINEEIFELLLNERNA